MSKEEFEEELEEAIEEGDEPENEEEVVAEESSEDAEESESEDGFESEESLRAYKKEADRLKRYAYAKESQLEKVKRENEELRKIADNSFLANIDFYEKSVKERVDNAKVNMALALDSADKLSVINAQEDLSKAVVDEKEFFDWKNNIAKEREAYNAQSAYIPLNEFLNDREEINPNSPYRDENLMQAVGQRGDAIDAILRREGNESIIGTPEYWNLIDVVINEERENLYGQVMQRTTERAGYSDRGSPQQGRARQPYVSPVAAVAKRGNSSSPRRVTMSEDENEFLSDLGIPKSAYLSLKEQDANDKSPRRIFNEFYSRGKR